MKSTCISDGSSNFRVYVSVNKDNTAIRRNCIRFASTLTTESGETDTRNIAELFLSDTELENLCRVLDK